MKIYTSSLFKILALAGAFLASGFVAFGASKNDVAAKASNAQSATFLFADLNKVFAESKQAQADSKKLMEAKEKADKELNALYEAGTKMMAELQELNQKAGLIPATPNADGKTPSTSIYSDEVIEGFKKESANLSAKIGQKEKEFLELRGQYERALMEQEQQYMTNFENAVKVASESIRKERGAIAMLNTNGPMVVAYDAMFDITAELIKRLNVTVPSATPNSDSDKSKAASAK